MIGQRHTKTREKIFEAFKHFDKPVDAMEIFSYLKKDIDLASIYRNLDLMKKSGLLNVILFGEGKKRYELVRNNHHHHFVCDNCGKVIDINIDENNLINKIMTDNARLPARQGLRIQRHNLEFFGLCKNCQ